MKKNVEDEEIVVRKKKRKMKTAQENLKMRKLKKEQNAGSVIHNTGVKPKPTK